MLVFFFWNFTNFIHINQKIQYSKLHEFGTLVNKIRKRKLSCMNITSNFGVSFGVRIKSFPRRAEKRQIVLKIVPRLECAWYKYSVKMSDLCVGFLLDYKKKKQFKITKTVSIAIKNSSFPDVTRIFVKSLSQCTDKTIFAYRVWLVYNRKKISGRNFVDKQFLRALRISKIMEPFT